jgi:hypothetical protein
MFSVGEITHVPGDDTGETGVMSACDLLTRFEGGAAVSVVGVDFDGER